MAGPTTKAQHSDREQHSGDMPGAPKAPLGRPSEQQQVGRIPVPARTMLTVDEVLKDQAYANYPLSRMQWHTAKALAESFGLKAPDTHGDLLRMSKDHPKEFNAIINKFEQKFDPKNPAKSDFKNHHGCNCMLCHEKSPKPHRTPTEKEAADVKGRIGCKFEMKHEGQKLRCCEPATVMKEVITPKPPQREEKPPTTIVIDLPKGPTVEPKPIPLDSIQRPDFPQQVAKCAEPPVSAGPEVPGTAPAEPKATYEQVNSGGANFLGMLIPGAGTKAISRICPPVSKFCDAVSNGPLK